MATVVEKMHPFAAAKTAGREPFKVRSLAEAEFGRKEIRLAEQEMPGLMALRKEHGAKKPLAGAPTSSRRRITRRRRSRSAVRKTAAPLTTPRERRSSRGRARRSRSTGGARSRRSSGPTAVVRR